MKSFFKSKTTRERIEYAAFSVLIAVTVVFAVLPSLPNISVERDGLSLKAHFVDAEGDGGGDGGGGGDGSGGDGSGGDGGAGGDGSGGVGGDTGTGGDPADDGGIGDPGAGCCSDPGTGDPADDGGIGDPGAGCCGDPSGDTGGDAGGGGDGSGDTGGDAGGGDGDIIVLPQEPDFDAVCVATSNNTYTIRLTWNGVSGAVNYPVRISGPSFAANATAYLGSSVVGWGVVNDDAPTGTSFTFSGLTVAGTYNFWGHAWNTAGWSDYSVKQVTCVPPVIPTPQCDSFTATPSTRTGAGNVTLTWTTTNATNVSINNGVGSVNVDDFRVVTVNADTTFTLTATNGGQTDTCSVFVNIEPVVENHPVCEAFTTSSSTLSQPGQVTLTWSTTNASSVSIDNGLGTVAIDGSRSAQVSASGKTTFILTAIHGNQSDVCEVSVTIIPPVLPPTCDAFTVSANTLNQAGPVTLRWYTSNATNVNINNGVGNVAADDSRVVQITANTTFTLTASGNGTSVTCSVTITIIPDIIVPTCDAFTVTPGTRTGPGQVTLRWYTSNATNVVINNGVGTVLSDDSRQVTVQDDTTFTLTATRGARTATCTTSVVVNDIIVPTCDAFTVTPGTRTGPGQVTLSWNTTNAPHVSINNGVGNVAADDTRVVTVQDDTTFTLTATRGGQTVTCTASVVVNDVIQNPVCDAFTANPGTLTGPGSVTLSWNTSNATTVSINQGIGSVTADGSIGVAIDDDATYILTATGNGQTVTCNVSVVVNDVVLNPVCDAFTAAPGTLSQSGSTTLTWSTTNATNVSINNGIGSVALDGSQSVYVTGNTTFVLTATRGGTTVTCSVPVTIVPNVVVPSCDAFTVSPTTVRSGESVTLTWNTTNASNVSIDQGIGSVSSDGTRTATVNGNTTFVLTAATGLATTTCQTSVSVETGGGGGGGGGSSSPRCTLRASDNRVSSGEKVTLSWKNTRVNDMRLRDSHGKTIIDTRDNKDTNVDEDADSVVVRPTKDTEYTLTVYRGSKTRTCTVEVEVGDEVSVTSTRNRDPLVAGISLSRVPYTGFDAGPFLTTVFYTLLILWGIAVGYILVIRRESVLGLSLGRGKVGEVPTLLEQSITPTVPTVVAPRVSEMSYASALREVPSNLPVGSMATPTAVRGYDAYYTEDAPGTTEEATVEVPHGVGEDDTEMLEARAHDARTLMSTDALHFIMAQTTDQSERVSLLDMVVNAAKAQFPKEDGWVVVNKGRILELLK